MATDQAKDKPAMTPADVAKHLKIGRKLVYKLIKNGVLRSYKVGSRYRLRMSEVEEDLRRTPLAKEAGSRMDLR